MHTTSDDKRDNVTSDSTAKESAGSSRQARKVTHRLVGRALERLMFHERTSELGGHRQQSSQHRGGHIRSTLCNEGALSVFGTCFRALGRCQTSSTTVVMIK